MKAFYCEFETDYKGNLYFNVLAAGGGNQVIRYDGLCVFRLPQEGISDCSSTGMQQMVQVFAATELRIPVY